MKTMKNWLFRNISAALILMMLTASLLAGCTPAESTGKTETRSISENTSKVGSEVEESGIEVTGQAEDGVMKVSFLDVGQGDCALVESEGHFMLIDAGERQYGPDVVSFLKKRGVKRLDYVVGTHPHSDHIGGLETVLHSFPVGQMFLPEKEHTTRTYEDLLNAVEEKGIMVTLPVPGETYTLGSASVLVVAPNRDYGQDTDSDTLNNWSIGLKIVNGNNRFLLCGDGEREAERDMLDNGLDIGADVLKLSHHGSYTASSAAFLDRVKPEFAVISCGRDNDYGYPHKEVMKRIEQRGIEVFRTDIQKTVTAVSDGKVITWLTGSEVVGEGIGDGQEGTLYILNTGSRKFHKPDCDGAQSMKEYNRKEYRGTREELIDMGYEPCQSCWP